MQGRFLDQAKVPAVPRKKEPLTDFGARLVSIRKARGLTQVQLAQAIGSSQRAISNYESATGHPPAPVLTKIADALDVTTDELLGRKARRAGATREASPEDRRLWKKFQKLRSLPTKDQRAVIRLLNSLATRKAS